MQIIVCNKIVPFLSPNQENKVIRQKFVLALDHLVDLHFLLVSISFQIITISGLHLLISCLCSSSSVISLKVSPAHQTLQTLIIGKPGEIQCGIEGKVAQVLWRKVGMRHRLPYSRVRSFNSKTLRFRRVQEQDSGQYVCRAISMSATVTATINVSVEAAKGRLKLLGIVCAWIEDYIIL